MGLIAWYRRSRVFPRHGGRPTVGPLRPSALNRALVKAGRADERLYDPASEDRAPHTAALVAGLPEETRRQIVLRLQRQRTGLRWDDIEWPASTALREARCGWQVEQVHQLFALALEGIDPVRPADTWRATTMRAAELPLAAYLEVEPGLDPTERAAFHAYLRTLLVMYAGGHEQDHRPRPAEVAFGERLRAAALPRGFDPEPLLPKGELFGFTARRALGATLYDEPALRLLELCARTTEVRPSYEWLGQVRELLQLTPGCRRPLRTVLGAAHDTGYGHLYPAGTEFAERSGQLLGALAWAACVAEDARAITQLGRSISYHSGSALDETPAGPARFVRAALAALAALGGEPGTGYHRRLLAPAPPAVQHQARSLLAELRELPAEAGRALRVPVGSYTAVFQIFPSGRVELRFRNTHGRLLADVPSQVRHRHPARYADLRARLDELRGEAATYLGSLTERLHSDPGQPVARWRGACLDEAFAPLTRTLVWQIDTASGTVTGLPVKRRSGANWMLRDLAGQVHELTDDTVIRLWDPGLADAGETAAWGALLARRRLRQPVPQLPGRSAQP